MNELNKYKHPYVAIDVLLFSVIDGELAVYLTKRDRDPYKGQFTCQGAFIHEGETTDITAERVIREKIGNARIHFEQLATFSDIGRDPRDWVITVAYIGITPDPEALENNEDAAWFIIEDKNTGIWLKSTAANICIKDDQLGFWHDKMVRTAIDRMRGKISYTPISLHFLGDEITIPELMDVYKAVLDKDFNSSNFTRDVMKKQFLDTKLLKATKNKSTPVKGGRPSVIYTRINNKK